MDTGIMKYVASCSFGKDSLATILLALMHSEPLDEVVYCEVMFDDAISGEVPEHRDFIYGRAIPFLERNGIKVVVLRSEMTYIRSFYRVLQKGQSAGKLNSWPLCGKCCIQRDCKLPPIRAYMRSLGSGVVQYIGIAYDEQERLTRLEAEKTISLLEKYQKTERDAADICKRAGLYSPAYAFSDRNGCFFCPNAKERELRHLYECYPDLWARLLECQGAPNKATELFNRKERFDEIDQRFRNEDAQMSLFDDRPFRAAA